MTDLTMPILNTDQALLKRVREVTTGKELTAVIRDGAAALGIDVRWHEADVLAETVRHYYDTIEEVHCWVHSAISLDEFRLTEVKRLRRELLEGIDAKGLALVEEPVETIHATYDEYRALVPSADQPLRKSRPLSEAEAAKVSEHASDWCVVVVLTARCRRLVKAL